MKVDVSKVDNASELFSLKDSSDIPGLSEIAFTEMDMEIACSELSSSSAAGADGVPASLLKFCRKELRKPI